MQIRKNEGRKQTDCLGLFWQTPRHLLWVPGTHRKFSGVAMGTRGQTHFNCCLSIFLAVDWLRAVEAWRLGSMLCCDCVKTCVQGLPGCSCWTGCVCVQCMHSWRIWNVRFLTSMLSEMCVGHYLLIENQTSDGSPCECLANSCMCYFPSVE